jgi:hypothetical protein
MPSMAKNSVLSLDDDPRSVRDPAIFNRLKLMVFEEAIDRAWGCPLYILHRKGFLTNEQREAGDRYQALTINFDRTQDQDPEEAIPEGRELLYRRTARYKSKWHQAIDALVGCRKEVDRLVLDEEYPGSEREKIVARKGLQLLSDLFCKGTKRQHKK